MVPAALITMALAGTGCGGGSGGVSGGGVGGGVQATTAAGSKSDPNADYRTRLLVILNDAGTAQVAFTKALGRDQGHLKIAGPAAGQYAAAQDVAAQRLAALVAPPVSAQPQKDLIVAYNAEAVGLRALQTAAKSGDLTTMGAALDAFRPLSQDVHTKTKALLDSAK
jgi:hypothetical protein